MSCTFSDSPRKCTKANLWPEMPQLFSIERTCVTHPQRACPDYARCFALSNFQLEPPSPTSSFPSLRLLFVKKNKPWENGPLFSCSSFLWSGPHWCLRSCYEGRSKTWKQLLVQQKEEESMNRPRKKMLLAAKRKLPAKKPNYFLHFRSTFESRAIY